VFLKKLYLELKELVFLISSFFISRVIKMSQIQPEIKDIGKGKSLFDFIECKVASKIDPSVATKIDPPPGTFFYHISAAL